ncbi:MAG: ABC transporter permease [Clostridia bacterium]|nr:ABC transporter permease [Clostridia bacterium]
MEERIIDDEIGRGVRLKKTKDGYVDVTDELTGGAEDAENVDGDGEEISFEFPVYEDETDEDLIGLDPEEAAKKKREKEEAIARRKADCEQFCVEGEELLVTGSFKAAQLKFEKALSFVDPAKDDETWNALVGRCRVGESRAKTADFTDPDAFVEQYVEEGVESFEYDMGYVAMEEIKQTYHDVFAKRLAELTAEETPLADEVESKQQKRRVYLKERLKTSAIVFGVVTLLLVAALGVTVHFILQNFKTPDNRYMIPTIICGAASLAVFIVFAVFTNKLINAFRIYRANEDLESTENGERLVEIRGYKELYEYLLEDYVEKEETEVAEDQTEGQTKAKEE